MRAGGAHHPCKETLLREGKLEPNPSSPPKTKYISPRAGSKSGIRIFTTNDCIKIKSKLWCRLYGR